MKRREFSPKVKLAAFERANGTCECTRKLYPGDIEYDHRIPCDLGGDNSLDNCVPRCKSCHREKTRQDMRAIAKSRRIRKRQAGIKRRGKIRAWRRFDGTPVYND